MGFPSAAGGRDDARSHDRNLGLCLLHHRLSLRVWLWLRLSLWVRLRWFRRRCGLDASSSWSFLRFCWRSVLRPILLLLHPAERTLPLSHRNFRQWASDLIPIARRAVSLLISGQVESKGRSD